MKKYEIEGILVPSLQGWVRLNLDEAVKFAGNFKGNSYKKRVAIGKSELNITDANLM